MKRTLFSLGVALVAAVACSEGLTEVPTSLNTPEGVTARATRFEFDDETKTSINYTADGMTFGWKDSDSRKIAVFGDSKNQQLAISLEGHFDDELTDYAQFNISDDFSLEPTHKYVAYYPVIDDSILSTADKIPFDYSGQTQKSNAITSTSHLGDYDFMCSIPAKPTKTNNVQFLFQHQCCPIIIQITNVPPAAVKSVRLAVEDGSNLFTISGKYDLFSPEYTDGQIAEASGDPSKLPARTISENGLVKSSYVSVAYEETLMLKNNSTLYAWIMVAPADLTGKNLKVQLVSPEGNAVKEYTTTGKNFKHCKAYRIAINNEINPDMPEVDLGLPSGTLWASMNVGATYPDEIGDYYKYGETTPFVTFSNTYGMNVNPLPDENDPAYVKIGTDWQLPTEADWKELFINCNFTESADKKYFIVEGPNRNSIILPKTGCQKKTFQNEDRALYLSKSQKYASIYTTSSSLNQSLVVLSSDNGSYSVRAVKKAKNYSTVDLGLESGTLWSTINLDAIRFDANGVSSSDRGDLGLAYSWGELVPKKGSAFPKNYTMYGTNSSNSLTTSIKVTKYATSKTYWNYSDDPDGLTQLLPEDDIATQTLGEEWHIPTETQWTELISSCTWAAEGSYQAVGTSKKNGEKIILPVVGYAGMNTSTTYSGMYYWSSTLSTNDNRKARGTYSTLSNFITNANKGNAISDGERCCSYAIRPVKDAKK